MPTDVRFTNDCALSGEEEITLNNGCMVRSELPNGRYSFHFYNTKALETWISTSNKWEVPSTRARDEKFVYLPLSTLQTQNSSLYDSLVVEEEIDGKKTFRLRENEELQGMIYGEQDTLKEKEKKLKETQIENTTKLLTRHHEESTALIHGVSTDPTIPTNKGAELEAYQVKKGAELKELIQKKEKEIEELTQSQKKEWEHLELEKAALLAKEAHPLICPNALAWTTKAKWQQENPNTKILDDPRRAFDPERYESWFSMLSIELWSSPNLLNMNQADSLANFNRELLTLYDLRPSTASNHLKKFIKVATIPIPHILYLNHLSLSLAHIFIAAPIAFVMRTFVILPLKILSCLIQGESIWQEFKEYLQVTKKQILFNMKLLFNVALCLGAPVVGFAQLTMAGIVGIVEMAIKGYEAIQTAVRTRNEAKINAISEAEPVNSDLKVLTKPEAELVDDERNFITTSITNIVQGQKSHLTLFGPRRPSSLQSRVLMETLRSNEKTLEDKRAGLREYLNNPENKGKETTLRIFSVLNSQSRIVFAENNENVVIQTPTV